MVSKSFSKSKKTAERCSPFANALRIKVSSLTRWSIVDLFFRNPLCRGDSKLFVSRNHDRRLFISFSMSLHRQFVRAMGL